ncbi:MAG: glycoside hydrolase family 2 protein [Paludibacteraceae bacterium]|nr:glycoside hydrolase family 2 protein [Paludibacteraceae bacterium]
MKRTVLMVAAMAVTTIVCANGLNNAWQLTTAASKQVKTVDLPYTWNGEDGQDGGNNYFRGEGVYTKEVEVPADWKGKTVYMKIGAANMETTLSVNGEQIGSHIGGYASFMMEVTQSLKYGESNTIEIKVSNSKDIVSPPLSADFTFYGGILRPLSWVVKDNCSFNPNPVVKNKLFGSKRIAAASTRVEQYQVSADEATVGLRAFLRNGTAESASFRLKSRLEDASGKVVCSTDTTFEVAAWNEPEVLLNWNVKRPHLYQGKSDPYMYREISELYVNGQLKDTDCQPVGLRSMRIDPANGFYLNGQPYRLYGVCLHEEMPHKGRAVSDEDRKLSVDVMRETGLNYFRLAHYQHGDFTYNYLDSLGIFCWTEVPVVNSVGMNDSENKVFQTNAVSQMYELVMQLYNHPSIIVWGLSNEVNYQPGIDPTYTIKALNEVVKSLDRHRPSVVAAMFPEKLTNFVPDAYAVNRYDGWYYGKIEDFGNVMDELHEKYPYRPIGVSEYGVGANVTHHQDIAAPIEEGGQFHPEEYQSHFHESYWKMIKDRPFIWSSSVWAGFDFAVDSRNEGGVPGRNDKGLASFDRQTRKDAFYWYKANWNKDETFVYITSRRYTERKAGVQAIRVYANCDEVELFVNGKSQGVQKVSDCLAIWQAKLKKGKNTIRVVAPGNEKLSDEVVVTAK